MEKLIFTADDGTTEEFYVKAKVRLNGNDYLLVTDSGEDVADALIFKDTSGDKSEEGCYVIVEDEDEMRAILPLFAEILEDTDIII